MSGATGYRPAGSATGLKGTGYKQAQMQNFTPEQMSLFQNLFSNVGPDSYLSKLASGDEGTFNQMEAPALRQFGAFQGNLANRFSGQGMGGRRSSSFQNAATSANQNFAEQLQSQRMGLQRQALQDLMGMSEGLLNQRPYENYLLEKKEPFWKQLLSGAAGFGGQLAGNYFGNRWGT